MKVGWTVTTPPDIRHIATAGDRIRSVLLDSSLLVPG